MTVISYPPPPLPVSFGVIVICYRLLVGTFACFVVVVVVILVLL